MPFFGERFLQIRDGNGARGLVSEGGETRDADETPHLYAEPISQFGLHQPGGGEDALDVCGRGQQNEYFRHPSRESLASGDVRCDLGHIRPVASSAEAQPSPPH